MTKKVTLTIVLAITLSTLNSQDDKRPLAAYVTSSDFKDQFNQLDNILYGVYDQQAKGWREKYLGAFNGLGSASATQVWGTWYFPYEDGGMTQRWQASGSEAVTPTLASLDWDKIRQLPLDKINKLSPCEKADLYFGYSDFRITKHEMYWRGKLRGTGETNRLITSTDGHEGFCNGARAAGALLPEPVKNIVLRSLRDQNIEITFYPLDIKMLATMSYFHIDANKTQMIGSIVNGTDHAVNAATWDIALRSVIGAQWLAFFMDLDAGPGVATNVSVVGYNSTKNYVDLSPQEKVKYPNAFNKVSVKNRIYYLGEINVNNAQTQTTRDIMERKKYIDSLECSYDLYIENSTNNIIDGVWTNNSFVPDNIWFANGYGSDDVFNYKSPISQRDEYDDKKQLRLGNPYLSGIFVYNLARRSAGR